MQPLNTSTSVVDAFKSKGLDSSYATRAKYAQDLGITGYTGTAGQNMDLINRLNGSTPMPSQNTPSVVNNSVSAQNTTTNNINDLNQIKGSYTQTDPLATQTSGTQVTQTATPQNDINTAVSNDTTINALKQVKSEQDAVVNELKTNYEKLKTSNDVIYNRSVDGINNQFSGLRTMLQDANSRFTAKTAQNMYEIGGFRYTPQQADGLVYQAEIKGINELQNLENKRSSLILEADKAKIDQNASLFNDLMGKIRQNTQDRLDTINGINNRTKELQLNIEKGIEKAQTLQQNTLKNIETQTPAIQVAIKGMTTSEQDAYWTALGQKYGIDPQLLKGTYMTKVNALEATVSKNSLENLKTQAEIENLKNTVKNRDAQTAIDIKKANTVKVTATKSSGGSSQPKLTTAQQKLQHVNSAVEALISSKNLANYSEIGHVAYATARDRIQAVYGSSGVSELNKQLRQRGLTVDNQDISK